MKLKVKCTTVSQVKSLLKKGYGEVSRDYNGSQGSQCYRLRLNDGKIEHLLSTHCRGPKWVDKSIEIKSALPFNMVITNEVPLKR